MLKWMQKLHSSSLVAVRPEFTGDTRHLSVRGSPPTTRSEYSHSTRSCLSAICARSCSSAYTTDSGKRYTIDNGRVAIAHARQISTDNVCVCVCACVCVCMCMCVCACMCFCVPAYMYVCDTKTRACTSVRMHIHACRTPHAHARMHVGTYSL